MAIWGEIKKALNSTLGTTSFKSLDTIITEARTSLTNSINTANSTANIAKSNTDTNNAASKTGILSQKSSYIISLLENSVYGLSALRTIVGSGIKPSLTGVGLVAYNASGNYSISIDSYICVAKFIAPVSGIYKVTLIANGQSNSNGIFIKKIITTTLSHTISDGKKIEAIAISQEASYDVSAVGSASYPYITDTYGSWNTRFGSNTSGCSKLIDAMPNIAYLVTNPSMRSALVTMYCEQGEPVQLVATGKSNNLYLNTVTITYEGR